MTCRFLCLLQMLTYSISVSAGHLFPGTIMNHRKPESCVPLTDIDQAFNHLINGKINEQEYFNQLSGIAHYYGNSPCKERDLINPFTELNRFLLNLRAFYWTECNHGSDAVACRKSRQTFLATLRKMPHLGHALKLGQGVKRPEVSYIRAASNIEKHALMTFAGYIRPGKSASSWSIYTMELLEPTTLDLRSMGATAEGRFIVQLDILDRYFKRRLKGLRPYARHYFIRAKEQLCTSYHEVSSMILEVRGNLTITDYEYLPAENRLVKLPRDLPQDRKPLWIRCLQAGGSKSELIQIETQHSKQAWTLHHTSNDFHIMSRDTAKAWQQ